ncbi:ankyrin repeat domain-containing protein 54 [Lepeophtheirus salmonis]|nr:ankyrin repeat domain-containing protein 54-like [Lepeophtheirus salmonis]
MDSGVDTEPESTPVPPPRLPNNVSTGGESSAPPSASATPEPTSLITTNPSEDGYLGDCSSDGGNEKNFPMPSDLFGRFDVEDPPAGIAFEHVKSVSSNGYARTSHSRKMKHLCYNHHHTRSFRHHSHSEWTAMKTTLAEKRLRTAVGLNDEEAVRRLCKSANPNSADVHRRTGLHIAAAKGYAPVVSALLEAGADPNQKDALGNTALHLAACTNHIDVVTLLLRAGTNVTTLDNNGRTPIQLAQSKLKLLQKTSSGGQEMSKVKAEVGQVLEMMREYLTKTGIDAYDDLLNNFSSRFNLHQTLDQVNIDLQDLLDSLGNLSLKKSS